MTELVVHQLSVKTKDTVLVDQACFSLRGGELVALLGPNGAGKTTLIRASLGLEKTAEGSAHLDHAPTEALNPIARARKIAYLPQDRPLAWPARVWDVVALGRFSHGTSLGRLNQSDKDAVEKAILACDLDRLAHRTVDTLSGGERARMHCARAFAAEAPLLVADEPTAALDPRHQFGVLDLIRSFVANGGGALVVLHDIQLAVRYASRLLWMKEGRLIADGSPDETLTAERLQDIYGIRATIEGTRIEMESA
ncbi:MAG: ABC transporter ATP-binding protein, partial [Pseudomonadota bacterium]